MPTTEKISDEQARLEQTAAEWFFRRDQGLTTQGEAELGAWLRADPRHAEMFAEIGGTWERALEVKEHLNGQGTVSVQPRFRMVVWLAPLAAAATVALGYFGWWQPAHYVGEMTTAVGEIRRWPLPDGSTIDLNTDSTVKVAYDFGARRIELVHGEAHFAVAKNKDRPFTVAAGQVSVRAVGTAFDVRLRAASVDVLVTEGKVRVEQAPLELGVNQSAVVSSVAQELYLEAGKRVSVPLVALAPVPDVPVAALVVESVAAPAIQQSLAWQQRRVEFADATLGEMVTEFNRYNRHQLVIDDPKLAAMRFGGAFPAGDYESFVRVLETTFGVQAAVRETTVLRLAP